MNARNESGPWLGRGPDYGRPAVLSHRAPTPAIVLLAARGYTMPRHRLRVSGERMARIRTRLANTAAAGTKPCAILAGNNSKRNQSRTYNYTY